MISHHVLHGANSFNQPSHAQAWLISSQFDRCHYCQKNGAFLFMKWSAVNRCMLSTAVALNKWRKWNSLLWVISHLVWCQQEKVWDTVQFWVAAWTQSKSLLLMSMFQLPFIFNTDHAASYSILQCCLKLWWWFMLRVGWRLKYHISLTSGFVYEEQWNCLVTIFTSHSALTMKRHKWHNHITQVCENHPECDVL